MDIRPLSPTRAMRLIATSPAHCLVDQERTREMNRGSIIHAMVLQAGEPANYCVVRRTDKSGMEEDAPDYRTKSAQEHRDLIIARGDLPILRKELAACESAAANIRALLGKEYLPDDAAFEVEVEWESDGIPCHGRIDVTADGHLADLKTCEDARRASSDANIFGSSYDVQAAAYLDAWETLCPDLAGRLRYFLHFAEIEPLANGANNVITVEIAGSMLELGRARWKRAKALWLRCHTHNDWPGYSRDVRRAEAPPWALAADLNAELAVDLPDPKVSF